MSKIKFRYVANIIIEDEIEKDEGTLSLEEIKNRVQNGFIEDAFRELITENMENPTVTIDRQFADVYEVDEEQEHTMEEFMQGQNLGNPEDGSL